MYEQGAMTDNICVEKYLLKNEYKEVVTELQQTFKTIVVYDYLTKNGYQSVSKSWLRPFWRRTRVNDTTLEYLISVHMYGRVF